MSQKEIYGRMLCTNWIASRWSEERIVKALQLKNGRELSFDEGLGEVHVNNMDKNDHLVLVSPVIDGWTLVMGNSLKDLERSKSFCEILSENTWAFSLGIDWWTAYHFWMFAEYGQVKRYYAMVDPEPKISGEKQDFEKLIPDLEEQESIFTLSKHFGLDIDKIHTEDFDKPATLYTLS